MRNIDSFQKQTKFADPEKGLFGNCHITCLANLMGLPVEWCPRIEEMFACKKPVGFWGAVTNLWLKHYDKMLVCVNKEFIEQYEKTANYYLVSGISPRFADQYHQVIYQQGKLAFDPHPDDTGIIEEDVVYEILVPYSEDTHDVIIANALIHNE